MEEPNKEMITKFLRERLTKEEMKDWNNIMRRIVNRYCRCDRPDLDEDNYQNCWTCGKLIDWYKNGLLEMFFDEAYQRGRDSEKQSRRSQAPLLRLKRWFYFRVWCRIKGDRIPF